MKRIRQVIAVQSTARDRAMSAAVGAATYEPCRDAVRALIGKYATPFGCRDGWRLKNHPTYYWSVAVQSPLIESGHTTLAVEHDAENDAFHIATENA